MKVLPFENEEILDYDMAHRKGKANALCHSTYPDCSFSIIDTILGVNSNPMSFM